MDSSSSDESFENTGNESTLVLDDFVEFLGTVVYNTKSRYGKSEGLPNRNIDGWAIT